MRKRFRKSTLIKTSAPKENKGNGMLRPSKAEVERRKNRERSAVAGSHETETSPLDQRREATNRESGEGSKGEGILHLRVEILRREPEEKKTSRGRHHLERAQSRCVFIWEGEFEKKAASLTR